MRKIIVLSMIISEGFRYGDWTVPYVSKFFGKLMQKSMTMKLLFFILTIMILPVFAFSQKAYDAIYYIGKTQNMTVKFTLAEGYIAACELKTTDNKSKTTSKFLPQDGVADKNKEMKFYHYSTSKKTFSDYFILEGIEENYESTPTKIYGNYYHNGTSDKIVLTKI